MNSTTTEIKGRALTLATQGFTYKEIASELNKGGFRTVGNKRLNVNNISNILFRARKEGFVPAAVTLTKRGTETTTESFLRGVKSPVGISPATGVEIAKRELSRAVIGTSVFTDEFKTNVVAAIFQN